MDWTNLEYRHVYRNGRKGDWTAAEGDAYDRAVTAAFNTGGGLLARVTLNLEDGTKLQYRRGK